MVCAARGDLWHIGPEVPRRANQLPAMSTPGLRSAPTHRWLLVGSGPREARMTSQRRTVRRIHATLTVACVLVAASCSDNTATTADNASAPSQQPATPDDAADPTPPAFLLPPRPGERPNVTSGIPHIQLDQTSSDELLDELSMRTFSLEGIVEQPSQASLPGAKALTVAPELPVRPEAMIVGREFAHIHPQPNGGGSLHLRLPPDHAEMVVDEGWGEYHPFALDGTVPNLVMVYAPRDDQDLDVVMTIIEAAVAYATSADDAA